VFEVVTAVVQPLVWRESGMVEEGEWNTPTRTKKWSAKAGSREGMEAAREGRREGGWRGHHPAGCAHTCPPFVVVRPPARPDETICAKDDDDEGRRRPPSARPSFNVAWLKTPCAPRRPRPPCRVVATVVQAFNVMPRRLPDDIRQREFARRVPRQRVAMFARHVASRFVRPRRSARWG